jgi:hypothetical protein
VLPLLYKMAILDTGIRSYDDIIKACLKKRVPEASRFRSRVAERRQLEHNAQLLHYAMPNDLVIPDE